MLKVKNLKMLRKLRNNNKVNELALVEETRSIYKWDGKNWHSYKSPTGINVSLFEINQSAMTALPAYDDRSIAGAKDRVAEWYEKNKGSYFMLLSNEKRYFTIFHIGSTSDKPFLEELFDCLTELGEIKDISINEDNAIECWITSDNTSYAYYLFNYDRGIIECA